VAAGEFAKSAAPKVNQSSLNLPSFAKNNWSLQVLGRRPDGYHEVKTLLRTVSLHDDIHFELSSDSAVSLFCDEPDIPTDNENLIVRAAHALRDRFKIDQGARIRLKVLPPSLDRYAAVFRMFTVSSDFGSAKMCE